MNRSLLFSLGGGVLLFLLSASVGALVYVFSYPSDVSEDTFAELSEPVIDESDEAPSEGEISPSIEFSDSMLGSVERDLPYCTMDGITLEMDFYWPQEGEGPFPVVVYVHGGGWTSGDKSEGIDKYRDDLVFAGFAIVAVNYRLAHEAQFPAMIEDVKCAVRHLRAHAETYNIDPDAIGALGTSAGGHLVNLLGTADRSAGWDVGPYLDESSHVNAVVSMYGPADLRIEFPGNTSKGIRTIFGITDFSEMGFASPVTYATADDASFLLIHGEDDQLVPIEQSELFRSALEDAGVFWEVTSVGNANHGLIPEQKGLPITPPMSEILTEIVDWFEVHL